MSRGSNLRLLGGRLRGRRLQVAGVVRPTESRVREALFSIWGERVSGCRFLDLFAGSGAVGLEAVSRGAAIAYFVDHERRALEALRRNCSALAPESTRIVRCRLPEYPRMEIGGPFDLIFADPPYAFVDHAALAEWAEPWLTDDGELVVEHSMRIEPEFPERFSITDQRRYGECSLTFLGSPDRQL